MRLASAPPGPVVRAIALATALAIAGVGTIAPRLLATRDGRVDHGGVTVLFAAMSVGFAIGCGFSSERPGWRLLLSPLCFASLLLAALLALA